MKTVQDEFSNLQRITTMIAKQFGNRCEVVLHDLATDYNHTIVAIEGNITNRSIGGSGSNLGLTVLAGKKKDGDQYNYITKTKDGRTLRSSSTYLRNESGDVIGALCINYDISDLMMTEKIIQDVTMYPTSNKEVEPEIFANNVSEILNHLTVQCQEYIGKPSTEMTKEDKINAIGFFDSKGAFLISKAGDHIREYLMISKYTLYNYLELARERLKDTDTTIL